MSRTISTENITQQMPRTIDTAVPRTSQSKGLGRLISQYRTLASEPPGSSIVHVSTPRSYWAYRNRASHSKDIGQ
eukprot:498864-Rhodomonas_salina.1